MQITERGRQALADNPDRIDRSTLSRVEEYRAFLPRSQPKDRPAVSSEAREYVERISNRIILIDGPELARLMVLYNVGVQLTQTFALKGVDEDFFE